MQAYGALLLLLPLLGFAINGALGRRGKWLVTLTGPGVVGLAFIVSLFAWGYVRGAGGGSPHLYVDSVLYQWAASGTFKVDVGVLFDPLTCVMLLVVTGVGFLIHVYSVGYMSEDPNYSRFFAYMNLFIFSMLLLVLADNFVVLLVGWGMVGVSSYLLIGFWYERQSAVLAARKALVMNVIGDFGMMLAAFLIFAHFGSFNFDTVFAQAQHMPSGTTLIFWICVGLMTGAFAKSAQLPLHTWLPDAMEGPTPVSALIHAATMVTAGVYLVARCHVLFLLSPLALGIVAGVGAVTAIFAATIGMAQYDIKRVLAYSTMSQIGYMFLGEGVGAFASGIFHLVTHAFFKALLFMGAGSVIHALHDEQDIRKMGALRGSLPRTSFLFLLGTLAISGIFPLAGFWSKDEILNAAWNTGSWHFILYAVGLVTAGLTAFYMFRLYFLTFGSGSRVDESVVKHVHESPRTMLVPMGILAGLAAVGGLIQWPGLDGFANFLAPVFSRYPAIATAHGLTASVPFSFNAAVVATVVALGGITIAATIYNVAKPAEVPYALQPLHYVLEDKYYVDEAYDATVVKPVEEWAERLDIGFDRPVLDRLVTGTAALVRMASRGLRPVESGYVRTYALYVLAGVIVVVGVVMTRG